MTLKEFLDRHSDALLDFQTVSLWEREHLLLCVEACDCCYEDGKWYVHGIKFDYVTAWMPLPEPPEEGGARR